MPLAESLATLVAVYFLVGLIVALYFVTLGVKRFDPVAAQSENAPLLFRVMIFPSAILLWPLIVKRLIKPKIQDGAS